MSTPQPSSMDTLIAKVGRLQRAHYLAANPSEATSRRETHYTDLRRREARVRRLKVQLEAATVELSRALGEREGA